ncbi:MAG: response regulator [Bacteroidetes bacterium]|nr:response regulator [Bacteroidota bacterium]
MSLKRLSQTIQDTGRDKLVTPAKKAKILVVDDEENVLKVLVRILGEDYEVCSASNGKDGLSTLEQNQDVSIIISDQRMPVMSGTEFLNRSIQIRPECIRMILTGYTDVKDLIESINTGKVFQYITKPFEPEDLKIHVRRALEFYNKSRELETAHAELKQAYEQLIRSEKMSMLGKLMGSIAHEIRNPINNINNSTKLIMLEWSDIKKMLTQAQAVIEGKLSVEEVSKEFQSGTGIEEVLSDCESAVNVIRNSCELVTEIIEDLRGFSRLDDAEFIKTDLHVQIERALTLLKSKYKHLVDFVTEFGEVPSIMGLPGPISQVMINLINNAAQSKSTGCRVVIRTSLNGENAVVEVSDNGDGIPPDVLPKIFEPGFTTKDLHEGTGLGLSISMEIMKRHNGKIEVESEKGKGSTFSLHFPLNQPSSKPEAA